MPAKPRLTRQQWIDAAFDALTAGGIDALAVEPLAKRLGVTKGSFYWHFKDRDELLTAALQAWEHERTDALLRRVEESADPRARLQAWARHALVADKSLLGALHAAAGHPLVGPVLQRVTERRIAWLAGLLGDAGVTPAAARRRARLLYGTDLGLFQIARALHEGSPSTAEVRALVRELEQLFFR